MVRIDGGKETSFAPSSNLKLVKDSIKYEAMPKPNFLNGKFEVGNKLFPIGESGLYFISIDVSTNWISYLPVNTWNILGTAIPGGWEPTKLIELKPIFSDDKKSAIFSIDSLVVRPGVFKFRSTDGWKVTIDSISDNDCMTKGSKVSTSFGGEIDSFVLSGNNIVSKFNGIYKVELFWNNGKKGYASFTKLTDLPIVDYSNYKMGFFGDSYLLPNGVRANWDINWGEDKDTSLPEKNGTNYTWHFNNVTLFNNGEFKFRQGNDWKGLCIDFQDIRNWSGNAKGDFVNIDTYFHTKNSGEATYDFTLTIDAATEEISLVVDKK